MTELQRRTALQEACEYQSAEDFVSDLLLSAAFLTPGDDSVEPDPTLIPELRRIWLAVNAPFRALLEEMGMTQTACAQRFCIPLRTIQSWALEERQCPVYARLMMLELAAIDR